jgi:hypothetical protein
MLSYGGRSCAGFDLSFVHWTFRTEIESRAEIAELANEVTADDRKRRDLIAMSSRC